MVLPVPPAVPVRTDCTVALVFELNADSMQVISRFLIILFVFACTLHFRPCLFIFSFTVIACMLYFITPYFNNTSVRRDIWCLKGSKHYIDIAQLQ